MDADTKTVFTGVLTALQQLTIHIYLLSEAVLQIQPIPDPLREKFGDVQQLRSGLLRRLDELSLKVTQT